MKRRSGKGWRGRECRAAVRVAMRDGGREEAGVKLVCWLKVLDWVFIGYEK